MADIDLESKLVQDVGDKASAGDGSVDPKTTDPKTTDPKATDPTDPKDPNAADAPASDPDAATAEATDTASLELAASRNQKGDGKGRGDTVVCVVQFPKLSVDSRNGSVAKVRICEAVNEFHNGELLLVDPQRKFIEAIELKAEVKIRLGVSDGTFRDFRFVVDGLGRLGETITKILLVDVASSDSFGNTVSSSSVDEAATSATEPEATPTEDSSTGDKTDPKTDPKTGEVLADETDALDAKAGSKQSINLASTSKSSAANFQPSRSTAANSLQRIQDAIVLARYSALTGMNPGVDPRVLKARQADVAREASTAISMGTNTGVKYSDNSNAGGKPTKANSVYQAEPGKAASKDAASTGDKVVSDGTVVERTSPGNEKSSGVLLDYISNPAQFLTPPETVSLGARYWGAITVVGYDSQAGKTVSATVNTPMQFASHPTGQITVPEIGDIVLSEKLGPGCIYTWDDATKSGSRMPEGKDIAEGIVAVGMRLTEVAQKYNNGEPFTINSWYRPPAVNAAVGGASSSRHMSGDAIDFYHENMDKIHDDLAASHPGGIAICYGSFVHIDERQRGGEPQARWTY
jgi:hypothetical protein